LEEKYMSEELEDWINKALEDAAPTMQPQVTVPKGQVAAKSFGRGGIIRNPNTKRRVQTSPNQITDPRRPITSNGRAAPVPTKEEDFLAENPVLAMPSVLTDMDVNARNPDPPKVQEAPSEDAEQPLSYETTLGQLLNRAIKRGGTFKFQNPVFKIEISKLKNAGA
jgi:hypothetical protein